MAAAKKSVLSSLAVYAEDSEPESDSEVGGVVSERGTGAEERGLVSEGYGDDDFSKMEGEEDGYDEDDGDNSRPSEDDDSETEKPEADDLKDFSELEKRDPQELVGKTSLNPQGRETRDGDIPKGNLPSEKLLSLNE